jgi:molybdopterin molybdotransferase
MSEPDVSDLLTVAQAIAIIDATAVVPRVVTLPLVDADGYVLAEDIVADRDYPPFDKSLMDGYAVRCVDVASTPVELTVIGEIAAGQVAARGLAQREAFAIMTGAPLPAGADGIVPIEATQRANEKVHILRASAPQRFIARRGNEVRQSDVVLGRGTELGPAQLAVAASVGAAKVKCCTKPQAAILSTGDELIAIDAAPGPAQIRNSNAIMLAALLRRLGCEVIDLGIVRDDPAATRDALQRGMRHDLLFITGGMSMGEYDYVPRTLIELGAQLKITKLRIKPGKPFVFAKGTSTISGADDRVSSDRVAAEITKIKGTSMISAPARLDEARSSAAEIRNVPFIFGLPGNPLAGFVCTIRLAWRLIARLRGAQPVENWRDVKLADALPANGPREFYQPVFVNNGFVQPLQWKGSADVFTLARANALLVRAENEPARASGETVRVLEV